MKHILTIIKGFFIGIANIIPGVSGGTLAMILNIYDKMVAAFSNIFKEFKKHIIFLIFLAIGLALGLFGGAIIIKYTLNHYFLITIMFFLGLIIGGIPQIGRELTFNSLNAKTFICFIIPFALVIGLSFIKEEGDTTQVFENVDWLLMIKLFGVGLLASIAMIIPGISGSLLLILLGFYYPIIASIDALKNFDNYSLSFILEAIKIFAPLGIGIIIGLLIISKPINYLLVNHKTISYYMILGFVVASIAAVLIVNRFELKETFKFSHLAFGVLALLIGGIFSFFISKKRDDKL